MFTIHQRNMVQVIDLKEHPQVKLWEIRMVECESMRKFSLFFPAHEAKIGDIYPCTRAMLTGVINSVKFPWWKEGGK